MAERVSDLQLVTAATEAESQRGGSALRRLYARHENTLLGTGGVVLFLALWQWAGTSLENGKLFFSAPTLIVAAAIRLAAEGRIWNDMWVSLQEFALGYGGAILVGVPLGIAMGWYRRFNALLDPLVTAFYATPRVALIPLLIIWFGIGIWSKVAVVFLGAVFPILINTLAGVRNLDESLVKAARSFGASDRQLFVTVALPGSVPFILAGLQLGVGRALIGVVVGELVAAQAGVGYMMARSAATFQTDRVMVGVLIICFAGLVSVGALRRLERRFQAWRPRRTDD